MTPFPRIALSTILLASAASAPAQEPTPAALIAAQKDAMTAFRSMDGLWRGPAWVLEASGEKRTFVQTERIGPFLDGSVKVIEGRGHDAQGNVTFNAFGIVSYDVASRAFTLHSYAQGHAGDFRFAPTADGYAWEIPAGPVTIRYVATIGADTLKEVGDRVVPGRPPVRIFEMELRRVGATDWPAAGAIGP